MTAPIGCRRPWLGALVAALFAGVAALPPSNVRFCNGRGYRDNYGLCRCVDNFHGQNCEYQYCPFGASWLSPPVADDERNVEPVECSNMGVCDVFTGTCACRDGYEGRACERLACPTVKLADGTSVMCSGRGVCKTLRDAGREFDALRLTRPPLEYSNWDADRVQGCVCDAGYEGPDCSSKSCPLGRDPTSATIATDADEVFLLQCRATSGFFHIYFLGQYSEPIPHDADMGYLEFALQALFAANQLDTDITISIPADPTTGLASLCADSYEQTTSISFSGSAFGDYPPMRLLRNVSEDAGLSSLAHSTSANLVLRMATRHTIVCPTCASCSGLVFFALDGVHISASVDVTAVGAAAAIAAALADLAPLSLYSDLAVSVSTSSGTDAVCRAAGANTLTIDLQSEYGNLPFLELLDGSDADLTFSSNAAQGALYPCSNQGVCDPSGICQCAAAFVAASIVVSDPDLLQLVNSNGGFLYRAVSGDGRGGLGTRGDCGHLETPLRGCLDVQGESVCSGHGSCTNRTCSCDEGWAGLTCAVGACPHGRAWFDEPRAAHLAHALAECSNAGVCDATKGMCVCSAGYSGRACEIRDCPRTASGVACHGRGACMSLREYSEMHGFSYGNASTDEVQWAVVDSSTWDAQRMHECVCSRERGAAEAAGDLLRPLSGPSTLVSGVAVPANPLPGFNSWDCSTRSCPTGPDSRPYFPAAVFEQQRVVCQRSQFNRSDGFRLQVYESLSLPIYTMSTISEIRRAIEHVGSVANVTVTMPNADADGIHHACALAADVTTGGFVVHFIGQLGDVPLMRAVPLAYDEFAPAGKRGPKQRLGADPFVYTGAPVLSAAADVFVFGERDGSVVASACSASALGYCEPTQGVCICNKPMASSDGTGGPGPRGDCSYRVPDPDADDAFQRFARQRRAP